MSPLVRNAAFLSATTALVATLAGGALAGPAAASPAAADRVATAPAAAQDFKADSGDRCRYGHTTGSLAWRAPRPSVHSVVDVKGIVVDRPTPTDPGVGCADDGAFTAAGFVAYAGRMVVDSAVVRVDNSSAEIVLTLGVNGTATPIIDRVVVQVCRYSTTPIGISYCGSPQTYLPV